MAIGRSTPRSAGRSTPLVLTSSGQEQQLADLPLDLPADLPPKSAMHHGIYIMECIWQPFWILQEKVGISFYF